MLNFKRGPRNLTVKVVNVETGRVDVHKNISKEEADWIALTPSLVVEVLEVTLSDDSRSRREKSVAA
jgi:hypothetical protein